MYGTPSWFIGRLSSRGDVSRGYLVGYGLYDAHPACVWGAWKKTPQPRIEARESASLPDRMRPEKTHRTYVYGTPGLLAVGLQGGRSRGSIWSVNLVVQLIPRVFGDPVEEDHTTTD